jgi:hypothetical protein
MATITDCRVNYGLSAPATLASINTLGTLSVGVQNTQSRLTGANVLYSGAAIFAKNGDELVFDITDQDTTGTSAHVAGVAQVETATAAGTISGSGNASVVVTAAGMAGSPKTISVAVTTGDTAAVWAGKVRDALAADSAVSDLFTVGGTTTAIILTRKPTNTISVGGVSAPVFPGDDATLNVSLDNGTCTGITTAGTSANTTAGVETENPLLVDLTGDIEGITIPTIVNKRGILIYNKGENDVTVAGDGTDSFTVAADTFSLFSGSGNVALDDELTITASGPTLVEITICGESA